MAEVAGTSMEYNPQDYFNAYMNLINSGGYANANTEGIEALNTILFGDPNSITPGPVAPPNTVRTPGGASRSKDRKGGGLVDKSVAEMQKIMAVDPKEEQKTLQQYYKTAQKMYDVQRAETEAKTMAMQQQALERAKQFDSMNFATMIGTMGQMSGNPMQQLTRPPAYSGDLLSGEKAIADMGMKGAEAGMANQQEMVKMMELAKRADAANRVAMFNTTMSAAANIAGKGMGQQAAVRQAAKGAMEGAPKPEDVNKANLKEKQYFLQLDKEYAASKKANEQTHVLGGDITIQDKDKKRTTTYKKGDVVDLSVMQNEDPAFYKKMYDNQLKTAADFITNPNGMMRGNIYIKTSDGKNSSIPLSGGEGTNSLDSHIDSVVKDIIESKKEESLNGNINNWIPGNLRKDYEIDYNLFDEVWDVLKSVITTGLDAEPVRDYIEARVKTKYPPSSDYFNFNKAIPDIPVGKPKSDLKTIRPQGGP